MAKVYEAIADAMKAWGVEAVFGLMGEETAWLTVALTDRGIPYYMARHEATAVGMADGYSRASGKVGVALVSRGPGLTNALTMMVSASKARSRVVVIVGEGDIGVVEPERAQSAKTENKYVDQAGLLAACGITHVTLESPHSASADVVAALDRSQHGLTIAVNLPMDLIDEPAGNGSARVLFPSVSAISAAPAAEDISAVADLVATASRPVILAGRGAARAGAGDELRRLGDLTGSVLATTLMGKNLFSGDPYDVGLAGLIGSSVSTDLLSGADLVLVFGSTLDIYTTGRGGLFRDARVIRFDNDPGSPSKSLTPELTVHADARQAATALNEELARRGYRNSGYRTEQTMAAIRSYVRTDAFGDVSRPGALDPRRLLVELDRTLPANRSVVVDDGHHWTWSGIYLAVPEPEAFILPIEYFSIGAAAGIALGVAIARPERITVYCVGDGGETMTLSDIDTAVRYKLPIVTVVADDCAFGSEVHYLQVTGFSDALARCESPSFAALAEAAGSRAITVETLDDLGKMPEELKDLEGPLLIHAKIDGNVRASWIDFHFRDTEFTSVH